LDIPVLAGRPFSITDSSQSLPVAIVNVSFARHFFGNTDPLGKRLRGGGSSGPWTTIVGVVADTRDDGRETEPVAELYLPITQDRDPDLINFHLGIALRTTLPPDALLPAIREVIAKIDPAQPIFDIATMEQRLSESTSSRRTQTVLLSAFAFTALCLAVIGIYGILSYSVNQTTREIGIRMALGAQKSTILRGVVRRGIFLALLGIAIGLTVSVATVRYLTSLLFHVKPLDWISFTLSAALLLALAILASYIPARRAANVDPMIALRYE
jgi:putative ABC transport system permease protein